MKKIILIAFVMLLFGYLKLQAQSTEIKPGSVFPSITTAQKNAIAIKPIGLLAQFEQIFQ
jgi:hypothetical protein